MTEALKELIAREAEKHANEAKGAKIMLVEAYIAGATSMVEKMEGFAEWLGDNCVCDNSGINIMWWQDIESDEQYTTSELREIYFEQLKKKEV